MIRGRALIGGAQTTLSVGGASRTVRRTSVFGPAYLCGRVFGAPARPGRLAAGLPASFPAATATDRRAQLTSCAASSSTSAGAS